MVNLYYNSFSKLVKSLPIFLIFDKYEDYVICINYRQYDKLMAGFYLTSNNNIYENAVDINDKDNGGIKNNDGGEEKNDNWGKKDNEKVEDNDYKEEKNNDQRKKDNRKRQYNNSRKNKNNYQKD